MKLSHDGMNYNISVHYGKKSLCLDSFKTGAGDYIEHYALYTMSDLLKKLPFIKFGSPEYCCIQEMDAHVSSLKRIDALEQQLKEVRK